ncbi:Nucleotide-binding alpha-beta plait [Penicillium taxi]|uniref:Nucleotide-binding alpha-beta plait n=1 Tax=Penicillium taxi TaxID=168475 RepID=UPI0025450221|nr:Nucleotide-binding alpha-beta plait [Penicillium taxi]KAJ5888102.1 Nucleotide-binding alpha-beta plait [Penicillium taxi]
MTEVSSTRLYLGNLPRNVTKQDIEEHFSTHGSGKITEIKLMNGFGFIEYEDSMDARDVVPAFHGSDFKGERLTVQFARGPRRKEPFPFPGPPDRPIGPRPRRTVFRMQISGLPETSWQDLKDFARQSGLDVVYSEAGREQGKGFVEFETANDLKTAVEKLDQREFKGARVSCVADIQSVEDRPYRGDPYRSRSPRRPYPMDEYDRRFPMPRGYNSPRDHYRERSPIPRAYYDRDAYGRRTPPRPRMEDYPPPRRPYDEYDARFPPPPHRDYDPYLASRQYGRPRSPPRGEYVPYDRPRYW